jgi:hypothetical protein
MKIFNYLIYYIGIDTFICYSTEENKTTCFNQDDMNNEEYQNYMIKEDYEDYIKEEERIFDERRYRSREVDNNNQLQKR